jgi:hypothetical protein
MIKHKIMMETFRLGCLLYSGGESRRHNFRGSFQTGFRNPTTQDQYIGFNVGSAILLGSNPDNLTRYSISWHSCWSGICWWSNGNNQWIECL